MSSSSRTSQWSLKTFLRKCFRGAVANLQRVTRLDKTNSLHAGIAPVNATPSLFHCRCLKPYARFCFNDNERHFFCCSHVRHQHTAVSSSLPTHPDPRPVSLRRMCRRLHPEWCKVYVREVHGRSPGRYDRRHFGCAPSCRSADGGRHHHVPAIGVRTDIWRGKCCQARGSVDRNAFETLSRDPVTQNHHRIMANHHSGNKVRSTFFGGKARVLYVG